MLLKRSLFILILITSFLFFTNFNAFAGNNNEPKAEAIMLDLVLVRPLSLITTVVGVAILITTLPFTIPTKNVGMVAKKLVATPLQYTFSRPVGKFEGF